VSKPREGGIFPDKNVDAIGNVGFITRSTEEASNDGGNVTKAWVKLLSRTSLHDPPAMPGCFKFFKRSLAFSIFPGKVRCLLRQRTRLKLGQKLHDAVKNTTHGTF
jgi:hypothetical protein